VLCVLRVIRSLNQLIRGLGGQFFSGPALFLAACSRSIARRVFTILPFSLILAVPVYSQRWERLGPPGGMVISLAAASDMTVYLGTPDGHILASRDHGEHWELRGRAGGRLDGVVQRIVPDARNANRLLAAIWFRDTPGGGVFESADGARSWKLTGLRDEAVRALEQSPSDLKMWLAGTRRGVFRSTDDAQSWQRITPENDQELQNVDSLAIDPRDAQTIYLGTYHLPWRTIDGGKTWNSISAGMIDDSDIMSLRIDAQDPRRIFSSACSGIYRSEDGGKSWTKLQGIPYSSRRTQQIVQDPGDSRTLYAATTEGLWMTVDYGETWKRITSRETDANAVVVLPGRTGKRVLAGMSAQGILRSDDGGNSFLASNRGFSHRVITAAAIDAGDPRRLLVRAEGYGGRLLESNDGGRTWSEFGDTLPTKSVERIFSSSAGWWVAFSDGGLARFDAGAHVWRPVVFRDMVPRPNTRRPRERRSIIRIVAPRVRYLAQTGGKTFAATENGLWQLDGARAEFRRLAAKNLAGSVSYLSSTAAGSLLAIAGGDLWSYDAEGDWKRLAIPPNANGLLWVRESALVRNQLLLGTQHGVFVAGPGDDWRMLSNGLPAIASVAPSFSGTRCLMAMSNGSLYESSDGLNTWRRVDTDEERGRVSSVLATREEAFLIASEQEGILFLPPGEKGDR
jgi:photosystem II stability/assembly factor-like uncharacterized protein